MVKKVDKEALKEGKILPGGLFVGKSYILLPPHAALPASLLEMLEKWGIKDLYTLEIEEEEASASVTTELFSLEKNLNLSVEEENKRREAKTFFLKEVDFVATQLRRVKDGLPIDLNLISQNIKTVIEYIHQSGNMIFRFDEFFNLSQEDYLFEQVVGVIILSLGMGGTMKLSLPKLIELGISAFFHNLGMLTLPEELRKKKGALEGNEQRLIHSHTIIATKLLEQYALPMDIITGILQHHEQKDGKGYPAGLKGDSITLYAKIISVASAYSAQIADRPFRKKRAGHESLASIIKQMGTRYDDGAIRALLSLISLYPLGSYVTLENGMVGRVVETGEDFRFPFVRVIMDKDKKPLSEEFIVNTAEEGMRIVNSLK